MNRIYLIGNGFDCAHKLNTRYSDFLFWYLKECIKKANVDNKKLYEDALFRIVISPNYNVDILQFRYLEDLKEYLSKPQKGSASSLLNAMYPNSQFGYPDTNVKPSKRLEIIIKSDFAKSIINNCINLGWVDIEKEFYTSLKAAAELDGKTQRKPIEKIEELNRSFETLIIKLKEYLMTIDTRVSCQDILRLFDLNSIEDRKFDEPRKYLIICFNYTDTVDKYIPLKRFGPEIGLEYKLVYIHGKVSDIDNPLIFGYGDETDKHFSMLEDLDDSRFTKYFKSNGYGLTSNYRLISDFIDNLDYDVHTLGHSCGSSDRVLLKAIFDNKNCKEIKIFQYERFDGSNDYIDIYQNIGRCFSTNNRHIFRSKTLSYSKMNRMPQLT